METDVTSTDKGFLFKVQAVQCQILTTHDEYAPEYALVETRM